MRCESCWKRLDHLRKLDTKGGLTEPERAELARLVDERCREEERALEETTRLSEERSAALAAEADQIRDQNRELRALIQEQEAYLAEVERLVARLEERRLHWRERYMQVTGRSLDEPVPLQGGG